jgi:glycosyltransferase involved in cell wall biosynthesis
MPRVSVLVAAYNAAASIEAALLSVQQQSFENWECVVVDDGSTDSTAEIVEAFTAKDARFRLLDIPHSGVVTARNHGAGRSRGEFVAILDADDRMMPERLARQVEALDGAPKLIAVGTHVRYEPRSAVSKGRLAYEAWLNSQQNAEDIRRDRYIEMPVGHPTLMFRVGVLQCLLYRKNPWPEDWDLFQRILDDGANIGVVPEVLHEWTLSEDSLSKRSFDYSLDSFSRCRAHYLANGFLKGHDDYALIGYGNTGKSLRTNLRWFSKSCQNIFELHPGRIGQVIEGAPVFHHDALQTKRIRRILVSVAGVEARTYIRNMLTELGYREGHDFICTA